MRINRAHDEPRTSTDALELEELARELMRRVHEENPAAAGDETRVLMDVESAGLRCVLVRMAAPRQTPLLSPREREIARMIARGLPNKTMAAVLEISCWTVGTYLRRMFAKLHVTSRAAMIAKLAQDEERHL